MSALNELIERLQKATGPDRGFDDLIAESAGYEKHFGNTGRGYLTWSTPGGEYIGVAPRFTASIDAALTLLSDGFDWDVGCLRENVGARAYVMWVDGIADEALAKQLHCIVGAPVNWSECGAHKYPAIALCIAALRARAHSESRA